jgi:hypothetical protein
VTSSLFGRVDPLAALDIGRHLALSQCRGFGREVTLGVSKLVHRLRTMFEHVEVTGCTSRGHGIGIRPGLCPESDRTSSSGTDLSVWRSGRKVG